MAARHETTAGSLCRGRLGVRRFELVSVHRNDTLSNNLSIFEHSHCIHGALKGKSCTYVWVDKAIIG